jgi:hypothetical protein
MAAKDLAEAWSAYHHDSAIGVSHVIPLAVQRRRDFMAGALALQTLLRAGGKPEALLSELVSFGRACGTAAERAEA